MVYCVYYRKRRKLKNVLESITPPHENVGKKIPICDIPLKGDLVGLVYANEQLWFKVLRRELIYVKGRLHTVRIVVKKT